MVIKTISHQGGKVLITQSEKQKALLDSIISSGNKSVVSSEINSTIEDVKRKAGRPRKNEA